MKKIINISLIVAIFLLIFGFLLASGSENTNTGKKVDQDDVNLSQLREDIPKLVEIIRIWKLVDELELQEEQLVKFLPRFKEINNLRAKNYRLRRTTADELRKLLETDSSEEKFKSTLSRARNATVDFRQKEKRLEDELYSILSVKQQAKFAVFQDSYYRDMRRLIGQLKELSDLKEQKMKYQPKTLKEQKK